MTRPLYSPAFLARVQAAAAERLYLATEAADLAPVTEDPGRPDGDNWFARLHYSDKAWAERNSGQRADD